MNSLLAQYINTYTYTYTYTHIIYVDQLTRPRINESLVAMIIPTSQSLVSMLFPKKRNQDFLDKWLVVGLGQEEYRTLLEKPIVLRIMEVLEIKAKQNNTQKQNLGYISKVQKSQIKQLSTAKADTIGTK
jgi:hypothetical protein